MASKGFCRRQTNLSSRLAFAGLADPRIHYLVDRNAAKAAVVSLWETEEALNAADAAIQKIRSEALQAGSAEVDTTEVYEVFVQDFS